MGSTRKPSRNRSSQLGWWSLVAALAVATGCGQRTTASTDAGGSPSDGTRASGDSARPGRDSAPGTSDDPGSGDAGGSIPPTGTCKNPLDSYDPGSGRCIRKGRTCNALTPCPTDYGCENGSCICGRTGVCGVTCTQHSDCMFEWTCNGGLCREPAVCFSDAGCPKGSLCSDRWGSAIGLCRRAPATGKTTGQPCNGDEECQSLVCYTNVCLTRCQKNSGCPQGQVCSFPPEQMISSAACMVESACDSCTAAGSLCAAECMPGCATSADCPATDCLSRSGQLACADRGPMVCQAGEVLLADGWMPDSYCMIPMPCWDDVPCAPPYTCVTSMLGDASGICGRRAAVP